MIEKIACSLVVLDVYFFYFFFTDIALWTSILMK